MSNNWQNVDFANLPMPSEFLIDYVRVWQRPGIGKIGCDPASHPTKDFINSHPEAYQNANNTLWEDAGYPWPVSHLTRSSIAAADWIEKQAGWWLLSREEAVVEICTMRKTREVSCDGTGRGCGSRLGVMGPDVHIYDTTT
jgi:hypothetical protein